MRAALLFPAAVLAGCGASTSTPAPGTINGCAAGDFVTGAGDGGIARIHSLRHSRPGAISLFPQE